VHSVSRGGAERRVVEVAMFEGGYGTQWHKKIAARYTREHAAEGIEVRLWGDQRSDEIVKPRILRGDPPEVILTGGLPLWRLIAAGKIRPIDEFLDQPAYGSTTRWRDLFIPGTLDCFTSDGHVYGVPSAFTAWACWYNARLFREHGWEVPETWGDFDRLCRDIRAAGIEPLAFQGKYPAYGWWTFVSLVQRCGGVAAVNRLNAVEPGAFTHPDVVWAARLLQEMALEHFQHGAMAMTHTESQLQFVNDKAALIFCGVWLENEMKTTIPPDFEMRAFTVPAVEGGKGNPDLLFGDGGEWMFAMADARHPELGTDFCRYMVSPVHAPDMGKSIGVISPQKGGTPREAVSPALQSVLDIMDRAPGIFSVRLPMLLLRWNNEVCVAGMAQLLTGELTPEQFCEKLERGLEVERNDPDVYIPACNLLDPTAFGEPE
jgi:N-acetylglucosamine transport system substrate-binding protein